MNRFIVSVLMLICSLSVSAQTFTTDQSQKPFSFNASVDYTTAYFFRGYKIMDGSEGLLFQPKTELALRPIQSGNFSFTPYVGTWSNFSTNPTGDKNFENYSQLNLDAGVKTTYGNWMLDVVYTEYLFPNGFSHSNGELGFIVSYNDRELSKKICLPFALNPHVGFYQQVYDNSDDSNNSSLEFGVRPEFKNVFGIQKLSLAIPVTLGTSTDKFYTTDDGDNDFLGYISAGLDARYKLTERWYLKAGVEYDYLMSDSLQNANSGNESAVIGTVGIGFSY